MLQLLDDGTLDTVFICLDCGEEIRYSHGYLEREEDGTLPDSSIQQAIEEHDEECLPPKGTGGYGQMIHMLVGRCHVSDSYTSVLRYVISRLKHKKKTWRTFDKQKRRQIIELVIEEHRANREVYFFVTRGI